MKRILKTLLPICLLAAVVGLSVAGPAAAATPCWKTLINDWYDGRIDGTYAIPCYQQAINHLPTDVEQYSSAASDIRRALQARIAAGKSPQKSGTAVPPASTDKGDGGTTGGGTGTGPTSGPSGGSTDPGTQTTPASTSPGRKTAHGPIPSVINAGSENADSVPIPLLVLAGIAGLLLIAGSAGFVARRMQAKRLPPRAQP
jgi:hypothetical protein